MRKTILCLFIIMLCGCSKEYNEIVDLNQVNHSLDALTFKNEYEALNNDSIYKLNINDDNPLRYASLNEINEIINSGTGIIFLGTPNNLYSRVMVNSLLKQASIYEIDTIYYLDMIDVRDEKYLDDDGKIAIRKEAKSGYDELLRNVNDYASIYDGLNDPNVKRIYLPTLIIVVNGEILYFHEGTLPSQTNPNEELNEDQIKELDFDLTIGFVRYNARVKEFTQIIQEEKTEVND